MVVGIMMTVCFHYVEGIPGETVISRDSDGNCLGSCYTGRRPSYYITVLLLYTISNTGLVEI